MGNLIDDLRYMAKGQREGCHFEGVGIPDGFVFTADRAADRIETLEAALRQISDHSPGVTHGWAEYVRHIARTTLSP